ncbi:MAG: hypothetical protein IT580_03820 [Verrucomicrobiales bacterium]|nr:hypothetical protein [Verrucomicrobiales bacterium]
MKAAARNLLGTLATGYILFFGSERLFWSAWRSSDSLPDQLITWLAYSALAYLFLATLSVMRVGSFWPLFLAGAIYGWLTEGGLASTLYGTEASAPFPFSIAITALSWHALLSVAVVWFATGRALTAARPKPLLLLVTGLGIYWGVWSTFLWRESPPIVPSALAFLGHASVASLLLAGAWWLSFRTEAHRLRPGWLGTSLSVCLVGAFYVQHVLRLGMIAMILLPVLLAVTFAALGRHRAATTNRETALFSRCPKTSRFALLLLLPLVATATYGVAGWLHLERVQVAAIVYFGVTGPLGALLFLTAFLRCLRPLRGPDHPPQPNAAD